MSEQLDTATPDTTTEAHGVLLTDVAADKVRSLLEQEGRDDLRLRVEPRGREVRPDRSRRAGVAFHEIAVPGAARECLDPEAAAAGVEAFGVFAHDNKVDVLRALARQG